MNCIFLYHFIPVEIPESRPTYQALKQEVEHLTEEKCAMIQQSLQYRCEVSCQLEEKEDMIRQLQRENEELRQNKSEEAKKIALELDECKQQMSIMEEKIQEKDQAILKLLESTKEEKENVKSDNKAQNHPSVRDTRKRLDAMVRNEMKDMKAEEVEAFFTKVLFLLQTMMKFYPTDNTAIKHAYTAVLWWLGCKKRRKDREYNTALNYYMQALETCCELYGTNTPNFNIASLLHHIGLCHHYLHSYQTAIDYFNQSIQMNKQLLGPSGMSADLAQSYSNLGFALIHFGGCTQQAIENFTQALEMYRKLRGDWDRQKKKCLKQLAHAYNKINDTAKATAYRREYDLIK